MKIIVRIILDVVFTAGVWYLTGLFFPKEEDGAKRFIVFLVVAILVGYLVSFL